MINSFIRTSECLNINSGGKRIRFKINDAEKVVDNKVLVQVKSGITTINELVNQKGATDDFGT